MDEFDGGGKVDVIGAVIAAQARCCERQELVRQLQPEVEPQPSQT